MPRVTDQVHACPQCGGVVARVHRHLRDRLMGLILRIHRYRCSNPECRWEGVVSVPPPPTAPRTRPKWLSTVSVGWPARVAWMAVGALAVVVPLEGGRYLVERQRARAAAALIQPGPELLAPLPGESFDGAALATVVTPTADNPTPLERRNACLWGVPGRNPYKGTPRQVLAGANLPPDVVRKFETMIERRRVSGRVEISNSAIWSDNGRRRFDPKVTAMGFGKTLCFNTRVNFPAGHVEVADLYETTDESGGKYAVMVPYVCGNVAVLAERAERAESPPVYTSVPEPGTWASLAAGLAALVWVMRRRPCPARNALPSSRNDPPLTRSPV
jgi:hypothetical protein